MIPLRHTWQVALRYIRALLRQPAWVGISLTQPVIWLLLFGALFKRTADIPGFTGGSYIEFLTPGVVVMLALSSAWVGMGFIEDINRGTMDRLLVSPSNLPRAHVPLVAGLSLAAVASDRGLAGSEDRPDQDGDDEGDGNDQADVEGGRGPAEGCDVHLGSPFSLCVRRSVGRR